ncbi:MAG: hypothetical protein FJ197_02220 [Gammaproteobacteria bacterium]|nr:hypothetical protein [Gammaproteobacteria bacterium]
MTKTGTDNVNAVTLMDDRDCGEAGDDFIRVSCTGDDETGVFTRIERVRVRDFGSESTGVMSLRRLFAGLLTTHAAAMELATAYARHKGIPVVCSRPRSR